MGALSDVGYDVGIEIAKGVQCTKCQMHQTPGCDDHPYPGSVQFLRPLDGISDAIQKSWKHGGRLEQSMDHLMSSLFGS